MEEAQERGLTVLELLRSYLAESHGRDKEMSSGLGSVALYMGCNF